MSPFESVLASAPFGAGQLELVGKERAAGHFISGLRPKPTRLMSMPICSAWIVCNFAPACRGGQLACARNDE
ncbi:hypothetical protein V1288_002729 [Bradyrhizobium sp. AZCC 2176]